MGPIIQQLESIIPEYADLLKQLFLSAANDNTPPGKWNRKEQLGHLIDSAQNNIRRFIEGQYQSTPPVIVYNQDEWVRINNYRDYAAVDLIDLWILLNKQICSILKAMPADKYNNTCIRRETHTLEWLAEDYIKHLLYHLHKLLGLEPIPYP